MRTISGVMAYLWRKGGEGGLSTIAYLIHPFLFPSNDFRFKFRSVDLYSTGRAAR